MRELLEIAWLASLLVTIISAFVAYYLDRTLALAQSGNSRINTANYRKWEGISALTLGAAGLILMAVSVALLSL